MKPWASPGSRLFPAGPHTDLQNTIVPLQTFLKDIEEDLPVSTQCSEGDRLPGGPCVQVKHLRFPAALNANPFPAVPGAGRQSGYSDPAPLSCASPGSCIKNTHVWKSFHTAEYRLLLQLFISCPSPDPGRRQDPLHCLYMPLNLPK